MDVKEIVKEYLKQNGYDGLCHYECGCSADELMPCGSESVPSCEPGHKVPCDPKTCKVGGDCEWHIEAEAKP